MHKSTLFQQGGGGGGPYIPLAGSESVTGAVGDGTNYIDWGTTGAAVFAGGNFTINPDWNNGGSGVGLIMNVANTANAAPALLANGVFGSIFLAGAAGGNGLIFGDTLAGDAFYANQSGGRMLFGTDQNGGNSTMALWSNGSNSGQNGDEISIWNANPLNFYSDAGDTLTASIPSNSGFPSFGSGTITMPQNGSWAMKGDLYSYISFTDTSSPSNNPNFIGILGDGNLTIENNNSTDIDFYTGILNKFTPSGLSFDNAYFRSDGSGNLTCVSINGTSSFNFVPLTGTSGITGTIGDVYGTSIDFYTSGNANFNGTVSMQGFKLGNTSTDGYVLTATDTSGDGAWQPIPISAAAGTDGQVQYNDSGALAGGGLIWNYNNTRLGVNVNPNYAIDIYDSGSSGNDIGNSATGDWQITNSGSLICQEISCTGINSGGSGNFWQFDAYTPSNIQVQNGTIQAYVNGTPVTLLTA